jgi:nucleotide-binding universal stress UspA family protein
MTSTAAARSQDGTAGPSPRLVFDDILCAVDGKPGGFVAVEQAAALAGPETHLTLLMVTSFRSEGAHRSPAIGPAQAKRVLDRATRIAHEAGVPSTVEVDPATPPSRVILEWSRERDLLALGAPATSRLGRHFIAGVADTALGSFTTPLFTARATPPEHQFGHRVLVASDGREGSDQLVELGQRLAQARGAEMTLLHASGHESRERQDRVEEQGRRLEPTAAGTREVRVAHGRAQDVIVATAKSVGASLVVMGSRRLDGLRAIGSVSRRVVHAAPCSVLLAPPERLHG